MFRDTIKIVVAEMKTFSSRCIHKQQHMLSVCCMAGRETRLASSKLVDYFRSARCCLKFCLLRAMAVATSISRKELEVFLSFKTPDTRFGTTLLFTSMVNWRRKESSS